MAWVQWVVGALKGRVGAFSSAFAGGGSMLGGGVGLNADCANSRSDAIGGGVTVDLAVGALCRQVDGEIGDKPPGGVEDCHDVEANGLRGQGGGESKDH